MPTFELAAANNVSSRAAKYMDVMARTAAAVPPGQCPLVTQASLLAAARGQSCMKCTPCREGLAHLERELLALIDGRAGEESFARMRSIARSIADSADCAIGYQTAQNLLDAMDEFADDFEAHVTEGRCSCEEVTQAPCVNLCPAHVDIPGYIALAAEGNYEACINLIRRDNPLPTSCAMICEHPCEERCRRQLIDAPLNIRGMKKFAVDQIAADKVAVPQALEATGKSVAVIGGGPAGLTCAYFLALRGHSVTIYERQKKLGGMLRYGIPSYRFPKDRLDEDIRAILSAGDISVRLGEWIDTPEAIKQVRESHSAMFVAIGAQEGKKLRLDNVDAAGVYSAVEMLNGIGNGVIPDYSGKDVCVIGGGNVAMDAARSAVRCGAKSVSIVYRRRQEDMTALGSEIESAVAEGIELLTLVAPKSVEAIDGACAGLVVKPQMIGPFDKAGRPAPMNSSKPEYTLPCQVLLIAVGQGILSEPFEQFGMPAHRNQFSADLRTAVESMPGVFVGGDCATGPATAIRAIAAGRVAADSIDAYLGQGGAIDLDCGVCAPCAKPNDRRRIGRANITERPANERKHDFDHVENRLTVEEAVQEASRCLRCDHFGCGALEGGAL